MAKRILMVDSNPEDINARGAVHFGGHSGESFAAELKAIDPTLEIVVVAPYDMEQPLDLSDFDGAVFTGSAVAWNTDDTRATPLAEVMRQVFAAGVPTYGSCNGMQLAASVLGGSVAASENGREDGLAVNVQLTEAGAVHPMMVGREPAFSVCCVHRDEVAELPEGAVLLAGNAHSAVQAFAYERDGVRFWGSQYHPEYAPEMVDSCLRATGREEVADAIQKIDTGTDLLPDTRRTELRNWLQSLTVS